MTGACPFFRIGDKVTVKTMSEVINTPGVYNTKGTYESLSCSYKNMSYMVFSKDSDLQGSEGVVVGGSYVTYLKVRIDGRLYLFPAFALKLNNKNSSGGNKQESQTEEGEIIDAND